MNAWPNSATCVTALNGAANGSCDHLTIVNAVIKARSGRGSFLPFSMFSDPAWDMLLNLYRSHLSQLRVSMSSLLSSSIFVG